MPGEPIGKGASKARYDIQRATAAVARAQAGWIVGMQPWQGLGYWESALARYLGRMSREGEVWVVRSRAGRSQRPVLAVAVLTDGFLLGGFIGLLAVRPEEAGRGLGQALVGHLAARVFTNRRWLFVSCDGNNRAALRFYKRLGFVRVGRLPDLVKVGHVELLLRKPAPAKRIPARA